MSTPVRAAGVAAVMAWTGSVAAQPRVLPHPLPTPVTASGHAIGSTPADEASLRTMLGMEHVLRLLRSPSDDDVVRGVERLAGLETPESFAVLVRTATQASASTADGVTGCARRNPRALLAVVHALASHVDREPARKVLLDVLGAPLQQLDVPSPPSGAPGDPEGVERRAARVLRARQEAALALAASGSAAVEEKLVSMVRDPSLSEGSTAAAASALTEWPPTSPAVLGGVTLTTPAMIATAAAIGDLRTLDAILGLLKASDPSLRAAAFDALGELGDARVLEAARGSAHDPAPRVRVAAAGALVHLGVGDAATAVEALVADDATALEGLRLASEVQGEGVTRAAAARVVASSDPTIRAAAIEALGSQTSAAAVTALLALGKMPALRGDAFAALARSPSAAVLPALESLAARPDDARMAGRAYFVRRLTRDARSRVLDDLLARLASSSSARDRVVGLEALVALGERPLDAGLVDSDPRVRAAAAMGASAHLDPRTGRALIQRLAVEKDPSTGTVLSIGLTLGDDVSALPDSTLTERVRAGGPGAPLAALALARRSSGRASADVTALLRSHDPVMRALVARGLGASGAPDASGLLASAYEDEVDPDVRHAIVQALALRPEPVGPAGEAALALAARLDPDEAFRSLAASAWHEGRSGALPRYPAIAWVNLVAADQATLPLAATGTILDAAGSAFPIVFDDDGVALEPGISPGPFSLRLAPRLPPYSPSTP